MNAPSASCAVCQARSSAAEPKENENSGIRNEPKAVHPAARTRSEGAIITDSLSHSLENAEGTGQR